MAAEEMPSPRVHVEVEAPPAGTWKPLEQSSNGNEVPVLEQVSQGHDRPQLKDVSYPAQVASRIVKLESPSVAVNWVWGVFVTSLMPAFVALIWFGLIPVGAPEAGKGRRATWAFAVNPVTLSFLSYLLISLFFLALDPRAPWRHLRKYVHILVANFLAQILFPGVYVLFRKPFELLALPTIALCLIVTVTGIRLSPGRFAREPDRKGVPQDIIVEAETPEEARAAHLRTFPVFRRLCYIFMAYMVVLACFMIAQVKVDGRKQGFTITALNIIAFIFKKIMLAHSDPLDLETAMVVAGLWIENLTDVFIVMAFPATTSPGATYVIVFLTRFGENVAFLCFQLNAWFKFRVWIKGKFKPEQGTAIEEDNAPDDRGHSANHPGYRRRQFRFLAWKLLSQLSSYIFFLCVAPVLRYGPNKNRFPLSSTPVKLQDTVLDGSLQALSQRNFAISMYFTVFLMVITVLSGFAARWWMKRYHSPIYNSLITEYNSVVVRPAYYSLVLSILMTNGLIACMFISVYYRVYFV